MTKSQPPVTDGFPSQRASDEESVSVAWRHIGGVTLKNMGNQHPSVNDVLYSHFIALSMPMVKLWETFSASLAFLMGIHWSPADYPYKISVTWNFDVSPNKRLSKHSNGGRSGMLLSSWDIYVMRAHSTPCVNASLGDAKFLNSQFHMIVR